MAINLSPTLPVIPEISIQDVSGKEGQAYIFDWDMYGRFTTVNRDRTPFNFTISLDQATTSPVSVFYQTVDSTATRFTGDDYDYRPLWTAFSAGSFDYVPISGTLYFSPGEITKTLTVEVIGDNTPELNEIFYLKLSDPVNATVERQIAKGNIDNDDDFKKVYSPDYTDVSIRKETNQSFGENYFRLRNVHSSGYLFANKKETDSLFQDPRHSKSFVNDGPAFMGCQESRDPLLETYYRFRNIDSGQDGQYLFAAGDEANIIRQQSTSYIEEGVAFNVHPAGIGGGLTDFYRFQSLVNRGSYLFVGSSEASVLNQNPNFVNEGLAFAASDWTGSFL